MSSPQAHHLIIYTRLTAHHIHAPYAPVRVESIIHSYHLSHPTLNHQPPHPSTLSPHHKYTYRPRGQPICIGGGKENKGPTNTLTPNNPMLPQFKTSVSAHHPSIPSTTFHQAALPPLLPLTSAYKNESGEGIQTTPSLCRQKHERIREKQSRSRLPCFHATLIRSGTGMELCDRRRYTDSGEQMSWNH